VANGTATQAQNSHATMLHGLWVRLAIRKLIARKTRGNVDRSSASLVDSYGENLWWNGTFLSIATCVTYAMWIWAIALWVRLRGDAEKYD